MVKAEKETYDEGIMKVESVLRMNPQLDPLKSYAHNSTHQRNVLLKALPVAEERATTFFRNADFPDNFTVADLGCSSGPNSLLAVSGIIESVMRLCARSGHSPPEVLVFLNDLPGNDFNSVFTSLPAFYQKLKENHQAVDNNYNSCFVSGMPGSFYGRLFPTRSLHFVHSSYSVHWLSQVPELPEQNKGSIYMASVSPPSVFQAHLKQFQKDFTNLLRSRAQELVHRGEMVLTFMGRSISDPTSKDCCLLWWWLSKSLVEMADEGLIQHKDIDSFNLPLYTPSTQELKNVVETEGSFIINRLETFEVNWDPFYNEDYHSSCPFDKSKSGRNVAYCIRSVTEPMLTSHFGAGLAMDDLFERYARLVGQHLETEKTKYFNIVISMTRK